MLGKIRDFFVNRSNKSMQQALQKQEDVTQCLVCHGWVMESDLLTGVFVDDVFGEPLTGARICVNCVEATAELVMQPGKPRCNYCGIQHKSVYDDWPDDPNGPMCRGCRGLYIAQHRGMTAGPANLHREQEERKAKAREWRRQRGIHHNHLG